MQAAGLERLAPQYLANTEKQARKERIMPNKDDICVACGYSYKEHEKEHGGIFCPGPTEFMSSAVPADFITAVRELVNPRKCVCEPHTKCCYHAEVYDKVRSMLQEGRGKA
jgi:hypothetical protein